MLAAVITRRDLFDRAGKLAISASAAVLGERVFDASSPRAPSVAAARRPQRVAVIGVDHYHATSTPNYLRILQSEQLDIVGVHAPDGAVAAKWASQYGSTPYTDYRAMVEKTKPEFIVALGRH